jgi:hypothetical protein
MIVWRAQRPFYVLRDGPNGLSEVGRFGRGSFEAFFVNCNGLFGEQADLSGGTN